MHLRKPSPTGMVAVLALFFALAGTAIATSRYLITSTSQIKPSVLKKLKGDAGEAGKNGAVGPQGAQGKEGLQGKEGSQGKEGLQGKEGPQGNEGPKGQAGSEGPAGVGLAALFGDGSDGDVTISTNDEKLTRDMYYHDLTVASDVTLNPNGWRIFVSGTLTLEEGAQIARDGNLGEVVTGGPALVAGSLGGSAGGGGGTGSGGSISDSLGGSGGAGSNGGGAGGGVTTPSADAGGPGVFRSAMAAISGHDLAGGQISGGAGGGGGGDGELEGGGSGGGVVVVVAHTVVLGGSSASIHADGGEGEHGGGVGGGGGGGVVVVVSTVAQPAGLTLSAKGGAGHTAGSEGFTDWLG
jgi:hypothetical protein